MEAFRHIIVFDGVCNLCNGVVRYVIRRDTRGRFQFASLQSLRGKALLEAAGLSTGQLESFIYMEGNRCYSKSSAALRIAAQLPFPARLWTVLIVIPSGIRDWGYRLIARHRYRLFGKKPRCMVPLPEWQDRFLC